MKENAYWVVSYNKRLQLPLWFVWLLLKILVWNSHAKQRWESKSALYFLKYMCLISCKTKLVFLLQLHVTNLIFSNNFQHSKRQVSTHFVNSCFMYSWTAIEKRSSEWNTTIYLQKFKYFYFKFFKCLLLCLLNTTVSSQWYSENKINMSLGTSQSQRKRITYSWKILSYTVNTHTGSQSMAWRCWRWREPREYLVYEFKVSLMVFSTDPFMHGNQLTH